MHDLPVRPGTTISHYRIVSAVGSGGMGEVYLAQDERLGRKVALKLLPSEFVSDRVRRERFEREARTASALNHPSILTVYDMGEESGRYFIVTEFIEGETLRHRFVRGKLKLREALEIGIQVAGALSAAHAEGIVHRDIKPENIMIRRDGYVKVLDFGLAKLTQEPARADPARESEVQTVHRATDPGVVMGTAQYMSPEQAQALPVDGRSDIFSFGVVLYEMITAHLPFEGATRNHVIVSILEKEPAPLQRHLPDTPAELQRLISKCLAKDPDERYQVAKDLLLDLKALRHALEFEAEIETRSGVNRVETTRRSGPDSARISEPFPLVTRTISSAEYVVGEIKRHKKGALITVAAVVLIAAAALLVPPLTREAESGQRIPIAVADFSNTTGQPELDGLSGMLITSLEQSRRLAVMTRSRMFDTLKRLGKDNVQRIDETLGREICRAEKVDALVTASISKFGDLYILDLKVLDPEKNEYVFTAKEQGKGAESIPGLIDRLSEKTRLGFKEKAREVRSASSRVANVTTTNLEAYQHYFRGQQFLVQLEMENAEQEFRKATELDPTFALAHYGRAYALAWFGSERAREPILKAVQYIDRAPEKEQLLIRAEKASSIDRDWTQSIAILKQLLDRHPDEKQALFIVGDLSYHRQDYLAAERYLRKVLELDPKFEPALQHLVWMYRDSGRHAEMLDQARRYVEIAPSVEAYDSLTSAHALAGDLDSALDVAGRASTLFEDKIEPATQLVQIYLFRDDYEAAAAEAQKLLTRQRPASERRAGYRMLAFIHTYRGQYRAAHSTLDEAIELAADSNDPVSKGHALALQASNAAWTRHAEKEARQLAAMALELNESLNIFSHWWLLDTYALTGEFESAHKLAREHLWGSQIPIDFLEGMARLRAGDPTGAIPEFEAVMTRSAVHGNALYFLAQAQLEAGRYDQAIDSVRRVQRLYFPQFSRQHIYPRTYYLLGKIHERKGDRKAAVENYGKFISLWRNADTDLPELIDAKSRLAQR